MIRAALESVLLFLAPFAVFGLVLLLQRKHVLRLESWSPTASWLAMAGLAAVLGSFLYSGLAPRPQAGFEPTHMEDGRVVPGRFQ